jgi:hypothetical protein
MTSYSGMGRDPQPRHGTAAAPERFGEQRRPCRLDVAIMPLASDGGFIEAQVLEFSDQGLGLSAPQPMARGDSFVIKTKGRRSMMVYVVTDCRPEADRRYRVDAQFGGAITAPNEDDEQALRAGFVEQLKAAARVPDA